MIEVYDNEVGVLIGTITEDQLQFLIDELEETSTTDQDYYLDEGMLDMLEEAGADDSLMDLLRGALGDREDIEIRWERV
jgi:processive 1,2-diacylglycerol beta-glucosyltransferase